MMLLYGYVDEEKGLMVISDEINATAQNTIIKLCTEDEVVEYSTKFIRQCYQNYMKKEQKQEENE